MKRRPRANHADAVNLTAWDGQNLVGSTSQEVRRSLTLDISGSVESTPPPSRPSARADVKNEGVYEVSPSTDHLFSSFDAPFEDASSGFSKFSLCVSEDHHQDVLNVTATTKFKLAYSPLPKHESCLVDGVVSTTHNLLVG